MPKVSIIVVTYNSGQFIQKCLDTIFNQTYPDFEVVVVDNASKDDTTQKVRECLKKTSHASSLLNSQRNQGFSKACNAGLQKAKGEYIALLNPDTEVEKNWLSELVQTLDKDNSIGVVGSKIYLGKTRYLDSAGSLYNNMLNAWSRGVFEKDEGQYDQAEEVPMVTACALLFRRQVLGPEKQLFDPDFFMYLEELDFNLRIRNLGYRVMYQPRSVVYHFKSQSVIQENLAPVFFKQYHGNINRMKLVGQYLSFPEMLRYSVSLAASFLYWDYYFLSRGHVWLMLRMCFREAVYFCKGIMSRSRLTRKKNWQEWMRRMTLRDLIRFKKELEWKQKQWEAATGQHT